MIQQGDIEFVRTKLLPWSGVKAVKIAWSNSTKSWPDIWVQTGEVPVITVTKEWARQDVHERRKRLVHEFLHLKGLNHPEGGSIRIGKYVYSTFPASDSYSKAVYRQLIQQ